MSSADLNPIENPDEWDVINVAGQDSPGLAQVGEFKRTHEWDIKKGKGSDGATITFVGRSPSKGTVKLLFWTPDHFVAWIKFLPLLKYDPTKKAPQPVDIYHPSLDDIGIKSVVTESIGNIIHEGKQLYSVTIELLEYFPPPKKSAVSTPSGSKSSPPNGGTPGAQPDPIADAKQAEIARLLAIARQP